MKILIITPDFPPKTGGIGSVMYHYSKNSSHDIEVAIEKNNIIETENYSTPIIEIPKIQGAQGIVETARFLNSQSKNYDLIYFAHPYQSYLGARLDLEYVVHTHGKEFLNDSCLLRSKIQTHLITKGLSSANSIVAVSEWTKEKALKEGAAEGKIAWIPPGVPKKFFNTENQNDNHIRSRLSIPSDAQILLTVSRLDPRKGHSLVLESIQHINHSHYIICGTGSSKEEIIQKAAELEITDRVHLVGYVDEEQLIEYYDVCDIFVMSSKYLPQRGNVEGFGIVYLEANAMGKPVIGTKTGGIPSAINHGETGLLAEPTIKSVKAAIQKVLNNPELCERLGENGRRWARKHTWDKISNQIDTVIENSIG